MKKMENQIRVLVWSEFTESNDVYPQGIHGEIAGYLNTDPNIIARTTELADEDCGVGEKILGDTDVLFWWGHEKHELVDDDAVERVVRKVREEGMGFVSLHSSLTSKPFIALMGTSCKIGSFRVDGEMERVHVVAPHHPIADGVRDFVITETEMYGEPFDVPNPKEVIFESVFQDNPLYSTTTWRFCGCTWDVWDGRVFYFRPGHETYAIYRDENIQRILLNASYWAAKKIKYMMK